ncbi:hypothetical protein PF005_g20243 [Phytophthora fragariae]|uniref:Uncharacterized protein n=1 Tax=Phytophthora fragariae TaxID=53985 RepID=A0A6A3WX81_9STRA|nr:hypothetical protein PF009_g24791 [Phytophthora fragariae]KAE8966473.1 hypothetical protein PF011_g27924 [Phytophthora fragariae]KAE9065491.1 hypothetical protein PF010_g28178 [Phytophthora fragariae]KAE9075817.1 hypothetical protein PF006_g28255 [Phytophthora fragariae]KAE9087722.1 hypothetical protein PF007_g20261 [Phytophthora fragariae]
MHLKVCDEGVKKNNGGRMASVQKHDRVTIPIPPPTNVVTKHPSVSDRFAPGSSSKVEVPPPDACIAATSMHNKY